MFKYKSNRCSDCGGELIYFKAGEYYHIYKCNKCKRFVIGNPIRRKQINVTTKVI